MRRKPFDRMKAYQGLPKCLGTLVDILAVQVITFRQRDIVACLKTLSVRDENGKIFTAKRISEAAVGLEDLGLG